MLDKASYRRIPDVENSNEESFEITSHPRKRNESFLRFYSIAISATLLCFALLFYNSIPTEESLHQGVMWSVLEQPFSTKDPRNIGFLNIDRPQYSKPNLPFHALQKMGMAIPTNSWSQNLFLGESTIGADNRIFVVPYILDTGGPITGIRVHTCNLQPSDRSVLMTYELFNGLTMGAMESLTDHEVLPSPSMGRLSMSLQWKSNVIHSDTISTPSMTLPIIRGAPYVTMQYKNLIPRLFLDRSLSAKPIIDDGEIFDGDETPQQLICGDTNTSFSEQPALVRSVLQLQFDTSDFTWLVFVSKPTYFICSNVAAPPPPPIETPGVVVPIKHAASFDLRAVGSISSLIIRVALSNNCTTGQNPIHCLGQKIPRPQVEYTKLLKDHFGTFPTGDADVGFEYGNSDPLSPFASKDEIMNMHFNWAPQTMREWHQSMGEKDLDKVSTSKSEELLMFALPHHQDHFQMDAARNETILGSDMSLSSVCTRQLHGMICPVLGSKWVISIPYYAVSFGTEFPLHSEMIKDLEASVLNDLNYVLPANYMRGAGDTYFSGKMLAKLSRIILIADMLNITAKYSIGKDLMNSALSNLRNGVSIWINGSADAPIVYDEAWGGVVGCGCAFDGHTQSCDNAYPNCPSLSDTGQNFGNGFYNDHHFHYGYHIYAAAVLARFDAEWGRAHHERVLVLIRDIANPSNEDRYYTPWRHKDWYLGSSWASGIVTLFGLPYPNGRNQESSSESVAAYEAVALYGLTCSQLFAGGNDKADLEQHAVCSRIHKTGRMLMSTEIVSTHYYWHLRDVNAKNVTRVYPVQYTQKVIGMLWSMLAEDQTWFGNQQWKSFGIQLMPTTVAASARDEMDWVKDMLPDFRSACDADINCEVQGWSVLVYHADASIGNWKNAWKDLNSLNLTVYEQAGGNGHSRTNSLWWIATRSPIHD